MWCHRTCSKCTRGHPIAPLSYGFTCTKQSYPADTHVHWRWNLRVEHSIVVLQHASENTRRCSLIILSPPPRSSWTTHSGIGVIIKSGDRRHITEWQVYVANGLYRRRNAVNRAQEPTGDCIGGFWASGACGNAAEATVAANANYPVDSADTGIVGRIGCS